jgi:hypothetical protein
VPIQIRQDQKRGCGWRQPGGLYMVSGGIPGACGRFPIYLENCPCCGAGIKPTRGFTWVDGDALAADSVCLGGDKMCDTCPMAEHREIGKCGLLWIGEAFYKTFADFNREAMDLGISRRIPAVPTDFVIGQTYVLLAHRKYETDSDGPKKIHRAAIFGIFKPQAIEYVVTGKESSSEIKSLEKRGLTPVKIERVVYE